jgi:hypothetical protein
LCERIERNDLRAGVLFRMAELTRVRGDEAEAEVLAREAEEISGTEAPATRNRAAVFRVQMGGDRWLRYKVLRYRGRMVVRLIWDLLVCEPWVLVGAIGYYGLFLGMKLKVKIIR